ncbi:hypothetical protein Leryth_022819 [Lithospermum erythrorhizon]|nr:hypothetical protein Leryth_022819 [Lithospermum erythrorhizon]
MNKKVLRNQDQTKVSPSLKDQPSKKQNRKAENPVRVSPPTELCSDLRCANSWLCKNSACRATCSIEDMLCYRIFLSYKLLKGTSKFRELHKVVEEAKAKLETEVGPINGVLPELARGIVGRLSVSSDIQLLCSLAIEKADKCLTSKSSNLQNSREGLVPSACKFLFEEVSSSSVVILLIELSNTSTKDIKGYKLWYCKTKGDAYIEDPVSVFPRNQRRILISSLKPSTEYSFRLISYTDAGDFGHSEAKCLTKSIEIRHKNSNLVLSRKKENPETGGSSTGAVESDSGFKVRDLGQILNLAWARENGCLDGFCGVEAENCCEGSHIVKHEIREDPQPTVYRQLDLNVASVPDLNEEITAPVEFSQNEQNGCTVEPIIEADDAVSHEIVCNGAIRSLGSGDSHTWNNRQNGEGPAIDSDVQVCRKRAASRNGEIHDSDSTLINGSPVRFRNGLGYLDENFEYCVKIIRWLECEGHITMEFRLKLLTWFSLRSSEQERRVVNTFIQTLIDDPSSLGGQLVDSFSDIISTKKLRNGYCSKFWH